MGTASIDETVDYEGSAFCRMSHPCSAKHRQDPNTHTPKTQKEPHIAHGRPFDLPKETEGFSSDTLEPVLRAANEDLATLVPNARFFVAKDSGHDIHQDQPELVIEATMVSAGPRALRSPLR